jgi:D-galactarolactone isomerase
MTRDHDAEPGLSGPIDAHMHVYDRRFPLAPTAPNAPPPGAGVTAYRRRFPSVEAALVIQPSHYGLNNRCTLRAAARLGGAAVVVISGQTDAAELRRLARAGALGARFHMARSPAVSWDDLLPVARLVAPLGWRLHVQMAGYDLAERAGELAALPCAVVIEHFGRPRDASDPNDPAVTAVLRLLDQAQAWVKLSAGYGLAPNENPLDGAVMALAHRFARAAPERVLWGSNWPHPNRARPAPDDTKIAQAPETWFADDPVLLTRLLRDNPRALIADAREASP